MAAWGIEELGDGEYKVVEFAYRWRCKEWAAKKPETRRAARSAKSSLDLHLVVKAHRNNKTRVRDTRKVKHETQV